MGALGATSPAALLAMRRAAQEAFDNLVGKDRSQEIASHLENLLTPEERQRLTTAPPAKHFPLGARLGTPPSELPQPKFDISERDRLFDELQSLKKLPSRSIAQETRMAELETRLNALLESS